MLLVSPSILEIVTPVIVGLNFLKMKAVAVMVNLFAMMKEKVLVRIKFEISYCTGTSTNLEH